jgi:hypothetical protein
MTMRRIILLSALTLAVFFPFHTDVAHAQERVNARNAGALLGEAVKPTGIKEGDPAVATGALIKRVLTGAGIVFFILMVYAGFLWMTARGNTEQVTKARSAIIAAVVGLIIIIGANALTGFIVERLVQGAQGTPQGGQNEIGGEVGGVIGCCLLHTGQFVWVERMDTENNCIARANALDNDFPDKHEWLGPIVDAAQCLEEANDRSL